MINLNKIKYMKRTSSRENIINTCNNDLKISKNIKNKINSMVNKKNINFNKNKNIINKKNLIVSNLLIKIQTHKYHLLWVQQHAHLVKIHI